MEYKRIVSVFFQKFGLSLLIQTPVHDSVCTDQELRDHREWVESVKILLETCSEATSKPG